MTPKSRDPIAELDERWDAARAGWGRALGRLRLDAEPLEDQIRRHRAACLALAAFAAAVAVAFVAIFAAFERLLIGLGFAALFWLPIVALAWLDLRRTIGRARAYEEARLAYLRDREALSLAEDRPARSNPSHQK